MPRPHPPEFRRRALVVANQRDENSVVESFFGTLQLELLDQARWETRQQLALAVFEWIEAWYNPRRRHSYCSMLSLVDSEAAHRAQSLAVAA